MIVTSVPKDRKIEANSTPTAPAPTITSVLGTCGSFRMSRLPTITLPSKSTPGSERASEPVANMMCRGFDVGDLAGVFHLDVSGCRPPPPALHRLHFVFAEQELDALGVLVDDALLARQHRRPVELEIGNLDAKLIGVLQGVVDFGMVQQHLGRDAADVQAGAAQKSVFLDDQRL